MKNPPEVLIIEPPAVAGDSVEFGRCTVTRLPSFADPRGVLAVAESSLGLPFDAKRCFMIFAVPEGHHRGGHSLRYSNEVMIGVNGSITVEVDDGETCWQVVLDDPTIALSVPTGVWTEQHTFSADAVMIVLASHEYDPDEFTAVRPGTRSDE